MLTQEIRRYDVFNSFNLNVQLFPGEQIYLTELVLSLKKLIEVTTVTSRI